jgi:hypothetical protein
MSRYPLELAILPARQMAALLAGLRLLQAHAAADYPSPEILDVLPSGDRPEPLNEADIEALCARLEADAQAMIYIVRRPRTAGDQEQDGGSEPNSLSRDEAEQQIERLYGLDGTVGEQMLLDVVEDLGAAALSDDAVQRLAARQRAHHARSASGRSPRFRLSRPKSQRLRAQGADLSGPSSEARRRRDE